MAKKQPTVDGPWLTMSAAYAAGFRGWALVVMTAIAGRESSWIPTASNTSDPNGGSYGLWQINGGPTPGWSDPLTNAQTAYSMAAPINNGTQLTNLHPWALTNPGATDMNGNTAPSVYKWGVIPVPWTDRSGSTIENYSILPWIPQAIAAYAKAVKPATDGGGWATSAELQGTRGWGDTGPSAPVLTVQPTGPNADDASNTLKSATVQKQCDPNSIKVGSIAGIGGLTLPFTSGCSLKAMKGAMLTGAGAAIMVFSLAMVIVMGMGGKGPLAGVVGGAEAIAGAFTKIPGAGKGFAAVSKKRVSPAPAPAPAPATREHMSLADFQKSQKENPEEYRAG